jgi:hypothetical protein
MELQLYEDYLYTRKLDLNLVEQKQTAENMHKFITKTFADEKHQDPTQNMVYDLYTKYNYLMYALPGNRKLYDGIKETFYACLNHKYGKDPFDGDYYIQCWLNMFFKGQFIDWHTHWPSEWKVWHGFYCLDVEPDSSTTYRLPGNKIVDVKSQNNLLVLGPSDGDEHRSSEWNLETPRITIAFDIVPAKSLFEGGFLFSNPNHWIPI